MKYIVVWKDKPGQRISTVLDARDEIVRRDPEYLQENGIPTFGQKEVVLNVLEMADGKKFAISEEMARDVLGWDV